MCNVQSLNKMYIILKTEKKLKNIKNRNEPKEISIRIRE